MWKLEYSTKSQFIPILESSVSDPVNVGSSKRKQTDSHSSLELNLFPFPSHPPKAKGLHFPAFLSKYLNRIFVIY